MKSGHLAIRVTNNPNHHLYNNNGTWWIHTTLQLPDYTKERVRQSLQTRNLSLARERRDAFISSMSPIAPAPASTGKFALLPG